MNNPIDLINVAKNYRGLPHQDTAIAYLQSKIPAEILVKFAQMWRSPPKVTQLISMQQTTAIFGRSPTLDQLIDLNACLVRFSITTPQRMRHFTGQIGHESAGLYYTKETDQGWYIPERFGVPAIACSDGGYKYRGAGVMQLSMPDNYEAFAKFMKDPKIFDLGCPYVAEVYPCTSGGWWWMKNNMNALCDRGASVEEISRMVNLGGGAGEINGLSDRINYYAKASAILGA